MEKSDQFVYSKLRYDETFQYRYEEGDGVMERSVKVNGEAALNIGDGHKMTFEEWNKLGIELNNEWEHIATHV